jgi:hypothetical protein
MLSRHTGTSPDADPLDPRLTARVYSTVVAVLGGEPAVPCTRNPLQRG